LLSFAPGKRARMATTKYQHLLETAERRIGLAELARRLKAPEHLVQAWIKGHATMPERKLLLLADVAEDLRDES
jgi:hypothetical protein